LDEVFNILLLSGVGRPGSNVQAGRVETAVVRVVDDDAIQREVSRVEVLLIHVPGDGDAGQVLVSRFHQGAGNDDVWDSWHRGGQLRVNLFDWQY